MNLSLKTQFLNQIIAFTSKRLSHLRLLQNGRSGRCSQLGKLRSAAAARFRYFNLNIKAGKMFPHSDSLLDNLCAAGQCQGKWRLRSAQHLINPQNISTYFEIDYI